MRFFVGTSGYSYKEWLGKFYPEKLSSKKWLAYYASKFDAVELNHTFYRMPTVSAIAETAKQVARETDADPFRCVLKANMRFGNPAKISEPKALADAWIERACALGPNMGPTYFQIAKFARKNLPALEAMLDAFDGALPSVVEFRHPSWHDEETYAALRARGVGLCISDSDDSSDPKVITAERTYLRLRKTAYTDAELAVWRDFARASGVREAYVFMKHEDEARGPEFATRFMSML